MWKNYLKTAWRNLIRNKIFTMVNVLGLTTGLACSILIMLWIADERAVDQFHEDIERIYQVRENQHYAESIFTTEATPGPLAEVLREEFPDIAHVASYSWNEDHLFTLGEISFKENGIYAHPDIFNILSIEKVAGLQEKWLTEPGTVVITQKLAKKYFGGSDPIGESITVDNDHEYTVTGVVKDFPDYSTMKFDYFLPFLELERRHEWLTAWGSNGPRLLIKLTATASGAEVSDQIKNIIREKSNVSGTDLFLQPFGDRYLYNTYKDGKQAGGRIDYVGLFTIISVLVLLIACINFMNLSTSQSVNRARETGIRKSLGAQRGTLVAQYMVESMILTFTAMAMGILLAQVLLPVFNRLMGKILYINYFDPVNWLLFVGIALITGLIAGSYPAFYLSAFDSVKVLKGIPRTSGGEVRIRKGLVIFQFTLSIILIAGTIVVYQQIQYIQEKNIGYDQGHLIHFPLDGRFADHWDAFRSEAIKDGYIQSASLSNHDFFGQKINSSGITWPGKSEEVNVLFETVRTDYDLRETMDFKMAQGRFFSRDFGTDSSAVIINEAAQKAMELDDPLNAQLDFWNGKWNIVGVIKDFNFVSLHEAVSPMIVTLGRDAAEHAIARLPKENITGALEGLESLYKSINPNYPFDYRFFDQQYAALYESEVRIGSLAKYFGIMAVLISCLGLLGLAAHTAEQRTKEIGIRKVLGASISGVVALLSKDFIGLILIAIFIATPIAWYVADRWLQEFAYKITLKWWMFVGAGGIAIVIALITVSGQAVRAALANPVDALRNE